MSKGNEKPVVWITGGGTGLGRAMALEFSRKGYLVAVSGRRADRLEEVVSAMDSDGLAVPCDVTQPASVQGAVEAVLAHWGRLDIAVANAGFAVGGELAEVSHEDLSRQFDVNVLGLITTVQAAVPHLKETQGRLALIASVASLVSSAGNGAYSASKAAVRSMGLTLAQELYPVGVSCTTIHPGFVESEIAKVGNDGVYREEWKDRRPKALMWPSDKAGRVMVRAIEKRKLEYVFTKHGKIGGWLGRFAPGLVHFLVTRKVFSI